MPQSGYWPTNLITASLDAGETRLEFPVSERKVNGGRDWASRKFPFRNGQSDEDTGARPRDLTYVIPLFRDVEEEHYPNMFNDLVEFVESDEARGRATLTDPEFGPLPVRMTGYSWSTSSKERDGGRLELTFETLGDENFVLLSIEGGGGDRNSTDVEAAADDLDTALSEAGVEPKDIAAVLRDAGAAISEVERIEIGLSASFSANIGLAPGVTINIPTAPATPEFTTTVTSSSGFSPSTLVDDEVRLFSELARRFQGRIDSGDLRSSDEIAAELDLALARVAAVRTVPALALDATLGWPAFEACTRLMASLQRAATQAFRDAPLVVDYELTRELSALEVAVILFGDPSRVQEVIDLNPTLSPDFLPRGTTLIVPLE